MGWALPRMGLLATLTVGRAANTAIDMRVVANEATGNQFVGQDKYEGKRLEVRGRLAELGEATSSAVEHDLTTLGPVTTGSSRQVIIPSRYVTLVPEDGRGDVTTDCFFEEEDKRRVTELRVGQVVTLAGDFTGYEDSGKPTLSLGDCDIAQ